MNNSLFENGYVVLENFFTQPQTDFFMKQVVESISSEEMILGGEPGLNKNESMHPMTWNVNSLPVWQNTLYNVLPRVEKVTDEQLIPTYSFQRVYLKGATMAHHTDWPWCQISLTINLGQSHSYPIYVTSLKTKESVEFIQKPGDAILYLGHNISHYRNEFEGDWYSQLFLHYVIDNETMEQYSRFDKDIFNFQLSDKMDDTFYTKKVKDMQKKGFDSPDMKEDMKDNIIPLEEGKMFRTTSKPRLDLFDHRPDVSLHGGQYKTKQAEHFMDSVHQTLDALTPDFCKELIDLYDNYAKENKVKHGLTHRGLDNQYKNTGELDLLHLPKEESGKYIENLEKISDHCIAQYVRKFGLQQHFDSNELFSGGFYYPIWEIHKYEKGTGHYEAWHTEGSHLYDYGNRMFVSMFYLNDVEEGGRTVFPYSSSAIKCQTGKHLSFPCSWPYVHYAQMPISDDKYIVTTWMQKVWPDSYMNQFVQTTGHKKQDDYRKTKFIYEKN